MRRTTRATLRLLAFAWLCLLLLTLAACSTAPHALLPVAAPPLHREVVAACPPAAHTARTDADATALHAAQVHAWHSQCAAAVALHAPEHAAACPAPAAPTFGHGQAAAARYAACRAALWRNAPLPVSAGMVWPLYPTTPAAQPVTQDAAHE